MGLFKKRQQTKEELDAMRAEMRSLREHLDQTDAVKDRLAERLGHLDAANERLHAQVGTVEERVGEVATKVGTVENDVVTVAGSIDHAVRAAVDASAATDDITSLRNEVRTLGASNFPPNGMLAELRTQLADVVTAVQTQQSQIADVALVATDASERSERTDAVEMKRQLGQLAEKVAAIDLRVNQVSVELTNQLSELSADLDRASHQADTTELIDRITTQLGDVTGGQERLANEQARFAIQFREDLAELADRLRKQR